MIGRQVILTNRAFTLSELNDFMTARWDRENFNSFIVGKPTPASFEDYIILPATDRHCVIVFSRAAKGLFSRENKIVLSVCQTEEGAVRALTRGMPTHNVFFGAAKMAMTMSDEEDRKGPAEDALQRYTEYMKGLLAAAGCLK